MARWLALALALVALGCATKPAPLVYPAPPGWLEALPGAGIEAVTLANNHACDLGGSRSSAR